MLKEKTSSQGFGAPSSLLCRFSIHSSMNSAACGRELLVLVTALEWGKLRCRGLNLDGWILHFLTVVIWSKAAKVCREADLWEVPVVPMYSILPQGSFLLRMALMIPGSCKQRETSAWAHMAKPDCKLLLCLSCPQPCSGSSDQGLTWAKAEEHNSPSAQLPKAQQNRDGSRAETAELLPLICSSNGLPKTGASRSLSDHSSPVCSRFTSPSAQGSCREKWDRRTPAQQSPWCWGHRLCHVCHFVSSWSTPELSHSPAAQWTSRGVPGIHIPVSFLTRRNWICVPWDTIQWCEARCSKWERLRDLVQNCIEGRCTLWKKLHFKLYNEHCLMVDPEIKKRNQKAENTVLE